MKKKPQRPKSVRQRRSAKSARGGGSKPARPEGGAKDAPRKPKPPSDAEIVRLGDGDFSRGVAALCIEGDVAVLHDAVQRSGLKLDRLTFLREAVMTLETKKAIDVAIDFLGDVNAEVNGANPLCEAVAADNEAFVDALVAAGADRRAVESGSGRSVLHYAAEVGSPKMVKACLDAGVNVDARDQDGRTPLLALCASEFSADEGDWAECAKLLLDAGATLDSEGELMLECVKSVGKLEVMRLLEAHGHSLENADPDELGAEVGSLFEFLATNPETNDEEQGIDKLYFLVDELKKLILRA